MDDIRKAEEARRAEARKAEKARRMGLKMMRMPLNDVILQVQNGVIDIKDLFARIELKLKEGMING